MSKPDISHLRTFGCICFPLLWPYNTHKPQPHTTSCIFLGYPTYTKGYICLDPITSRIYISRHVLFNETEFLASPSLSTGSSPSSFVSAPPNHSPLFDVSPSTPIPSQPASTSSSDMTTLVPVQPESPPSNPSPMPKLSQSLLNPSLGTSQSNPSQPLSSQSPFAPPLCLVCLHLHHHHMCPLCFPTSTNTHPMVTRSKDGIFKPKAPAA